MNDDAGSVGTPVGVGVLVGVFVGVGVLVGVLVGVGVAVAIGVYSFEAKLTQTALVPKGLPGIDWNWKQAKEAPAGMVMRLA